MEYQQEPFSDLILLLRIRRFQEEEERICTLYEKIFRKLRRFQRRHRSDDPAQYLAEFQKLIDEEEQLEWQLFLVRNEIKRMMAMQTLICAFIRAMNDDPAPGIKKNHYIRAIKTFRRLQKPPFELYSEIHRPLSADDPLKMNILLDDVNAADDYSAAMYYDDMGALCPPSEEDEPDDIPPERLMYEDAYEDGEYGDEDELFGIEDPDDDDGFGDLDPDDGEFGDDDPDDGEFDDDDPDDGEFDDDDPDEDDDFDEDGDI